MTTTRNDRGKGFEGVSIGHNADISDHNDEWRIKWRIDKFWEREENEIYGLVQRFGLAALPNAPGLTFEQMEKVAHGEYIGAQLFEKNLLLNTGINSMWTLICGGAAVAFNGSNARVEVGTNNVAAAATQTALQATGVSQATATMTGGYPTFGTSQQGVWQGSFSAAAANFTWNEFSIDSTAITSGGVNMDRLVSFQGTKLSGQIWILTVSVTLQ